MDSDKIQPQPHGYTHYPNSSGYGQSPNQPGQFPQYPPPPRRRRSLKQWYLSQTRFGKIGLGCAAVFLALMLCSCSLATIASAFQQKQPKTTAPTAVITTNEANSSQATATTIPIPTVMPTATPTPKPGISLNQAILGGSIHAFDQKFGANNCCYHNEWTPPTGPAVGVWDDTYSQWNNLDEASMNRVVRIDISPQGNDVWNASTSASFCTAYLPPDAKYQSGYAIPLADVTKGYVKVYASTLLAKTLPAQDFIGKDGNQGKAGTIYVYFDYNYDANHIDYCVIGIKGNDDFSA